jgi:hypothetical protein
VPDVERWRHRRNRISANSDRQGATLALLVKGDDPDSRQAHQCVFGADVGRFTEQLKLHYSKIVVDPELPAHANEASRGISASQSGFIRGIPDE